MPRLLTPRLALSLFLLTSLIALPPVASHAQTATAKKSIAPQPIPEVDKLIKQSQAEAAKYHWAATLKILDQAVKLAQKKKDRIGEADALTYIGDAYSDTSSPTRALEFYKKALPIFQEIGYREGEAATLVQIGIVLENTGEPAKALALYQKALPIFQAVGHRDGEASTLTNIGNIFSSAGKPTKALESYQKALRLYQSLGKKSGEANSLMNIGIVYTNTGTPTKALESLQKALLLSETIGKKSLEADVLMNLGNAYSATSNPLKAREYYEKALPLCRAMGDKSREASVLLNIGGSYYETGTPLKALTFFQQVLPLFRDMKNTLGEAATLLNIGTIASDNGNTTKALESYQQALPLFQKIGHKSGEATTLMNLGVLYKNTDDSVKALEYLQKALSLSQAIADKATAASALSNLGQVYARRDEFPKAKEFYQKALPIFQEIGNKSGEALTLVGIGNTLSHSGDIAKALELYQQALPIQQKIGNLQGEADTQNSIGVAYNSKGDSTKALESYQEALKIFQTLGTPDGEARVLRNIALVHLAQSNLPEAEKCLQESLSLTDSVRSNIASLSTETRTAFQEQNTKRYQYYVQILLLEHKEAEAYAVLQRMKSRTLLEQFQVGQVKLTGHLTTEEQKEEITLTLAANKATANLLSVNNIAEANKAKKAIAKVENDLNRFYDLIYSKYPDLATKRAIKTATLDEIGPTLPQDTALVEFLNLRLDDLDQTKSLEQTVLFVVTRGEDGKVNLTVHRLPITQDELTEKVTDLRDACSDKALRPYQSKAKDLYQALLAPAEQELAGKSRLVLCPDGVLWTLPFAVLIDKEGQHLIEKKEIAYAFSGTALKTAREARNNQKPTSQTLLALANPDFGDETRFPGQGTVRSTDRPITIPDRQLLTSSDIVRGKKLEALPGTQIEADNIVEDFGAKATVLTGGAAQEKTLKDRIATVRYLHLATHGYFNDVAPFESFIALAVPPKGSKEDGLLTAREVLNLDLSSCEMAVLSACESGRGEQKGGEGIVGMSWALFAAGCPTQIVSQWNVNDISTAALMSRFYHDLATGKTKGDALRQAMLSLLADDKYKHPRFWSPFILIGDWR